MKVTELDAADAYCRYLAGRHYENFSVAAHFLPSPTRRHLARLYAYCRTTDDLGDEGAGGVERLAAWREMVLSCFGDRHDPLHPVLLALRVTARECMLTVEPFLQLIAANVQDQSVTTYEDWPALRSYCMLSAAPVGRLVLRVWGINQPDADALSDDVCIGLQLANFAQDVSVDLRKGRTYLLQSDLRDVGTAGAVKRMCALAEKLLDSGRQLEARVPRLLTAQLALYRLGGLAIIDAIRRLDYETAETRPAVSTSVKLRLMSSAVARSLGQRLLYPLAV
jgi:squalene synthase HpnC